MEWMENACIDPACCEQKTAHSLSQCTTGLLTIIRYARLVARREIKEETRLIAWMEHKEQCRDKDCIAMQHKKYIVPRVLDIERVVGAE